MHVGAPAARERAGQRKSARRRHAITPKTS